MIVQPFEDFEAAAAGHLQIGDENARERIGLAIGVAAFAFQVGHGVRAVVADVNRKRDAVFLEGALEEQNVIRIVLRHHNHESLIPRHHENVFAGQWRCQTGAREGQPRWTLFANPAKLPSKGAMPENCVILLVEDDFNDAFFVERALKELGFPGKLKHVTDSDRAREFLAAGSPLPEIIVADSALSPGATGIELLEAVRSTEAWKKIPFIVLSGGMSDSMRQRAAEAGATAVLTKATQLKETTQQLRTILGHLPPNCREWLKS